MEGALLMRISNLSRGIIVALVVLVLAGAFGCAKKSIDQEPKTPSLELLSTAQLADEANNAFMSKDYAKSELYYSRLQQRSDISEDTRKLALGRLASSALAVGHYHQARIGPGRAGRVGSPGA